MGNLVVGLWNLARFSLKYVAIPAGKPFSRNVQYRAQEHAWYSSQAIPKRVSRTLQIFPSHMVISLRFS